MEEQNYNSLENETGEQKEIETEESKSFGSFLEFYWRTKSTRYSIILVMIIVFMGVFWIFLPKSGGGGGDMVGFVLIPLIFAIVISPFIIAIGTWCGAMERKEINFLTFLLAIITIIVYPLSLLLLQNIFVLVSGILLLPVLNVVIVYLVVRKNLKQK